jgi:hypothetical protein
MIVPGFGGCSNKGNKKTHRVIYSMTCDKITKYPNPGINLAVNTNHFSWNFRMIDTLRFIRTLTIFWHRINFGWYNISTAYSPGFADQLF